MWVEYRFVNSREIRNRDSTAISFEYSNQGSFSYPQYRGQKAGCGIVVTKDPSSRSIFRTATKKGTTSATV